MNDCRYSEIPTHPFHSSFWRKHPEFYRKDAPTAVPAMASPNSGATPGYFATCLDYAHPEVRDYYKALIDETLDRYDIDGLELDFMREPYVFSPGEEAEGRSILTEWIRDVRKLVDQAAARQAHPIRLGVRVPSRPETAAALGLDAAQWAREGLIDLLVVTPRGATVEFDMPLRQWRNAIGINSPTTLAGGLEVRYQPCADGPAIKRCREISPARPSPCWTAAAMRSISSIISKERGRCRSTGGHSR